MATRGERDHATGGGGRSFLVVRPDAFNYVWDNSAGTTLYLPVGMEGALFSVVDAPNWVVGAFLPDNFFTRGGDR
jgi:hypothetical protein